jgi:hypothetical protein
MSGIFSFSKHLLFLFSITKEPHYFHFVSYFPIFVKKLVRIKKVCFNCLVQIYENMKQSENKMTIFVIEKKWQF